MLPLSVFGYIWHMCRLPVVNSELCYISRADPGILEESAPVY